MVHNEHQRQGATNVTVRNIITSMRLISDVNWSEFFEDVSLADATLRRHTDLAQMDFATRNMYRSAIETLSRRSVRSELEITQALVAATEAFAASNPNDPRKRDPRDITCWGGGAARSKETLDIARRRETGRAP